MKFQPIAIVGQSCFLPAVRSPEELWKVLINKKTLLTQATREDWGFEPSYILQKGKLPLIPHSVGGHLKSSDKDELFEMALFCGSEILKNTSWQKSKKRTGIVLGNLAYPTKRLNELYRAYWFKQNKIPFPREVDWKSRFNSGYPARFLSNEFGLEGPAFCVDAACASSIYAIKYACDLLHSNECDLVMSGGINAVEGSFLHIGFESLKALSRSGQMKPFSTRADGLLPSKGAAFVALRRLEDALKYQEPILGIIRGVGVSNDGKTGSLLTPSSKAQQKAVRKAYVSSGINPDEISYLETHATGTTIGDLCELETLRQCFHHELILGSLKANIGHTLAASGCLALIRILQSFKEGKISPSLDIDQPLDEFKKSPFKIINQEVDWGSKRKLAAINAFGFGGNNGHVIVQDLESYQGSSKSSVYVKMECEEPVAVVGIGIRWGKYKNKTEVRELIKSQKSKREDGRIENFELDLSSINIPPADLSSILPQQLILMPVLEEALSDLNSKLSENTGVLIGMSTDLESCRHKLRLDLLLDNYSFDDSVLPELKASTTLGCMPNIPANRFNFMKNWKGPSHTVFAEEESGSVALDLAIKALRGSEVDAMIVGGVDLSCEPAHQSIVRDNLSRDSSDAACVFILKKLSVAKINGDRIYHVLSKDVIPESRLHSLLGYSYSCTNLINLASEILLKWNGDQILKETKYIKSINAHLPEIEIELKMKKAPVLPKVLPLYFDKVVEFTRKEIEEHASGKLSNIFGDRFLSTDAYELRVRMPEEPLLLTDRVVEIHAEKASMGVGSIITETDIPDRAWFIHEGRMLPGPAIEAGQSDLFLISYLGVDFENKGERTYRLLGCEAKYLRDLPKSGETLRYNIHVDRHVKNGRSRLFFFHYDCWIGDEKFLEIRNGQAGFFSKEELDASQGVIWNKPVKSVVSKNIRSYSKEKVQAFSLGDAYACFGEGFEALATHSRTPRIPDGQNLLFDEVLELDIENSYMKISRRIDVNDWFFKGHFKNDPCMPGTLMTEMAFQALSFYATALGATLNRDCFRFIPALGENCRLTCRGQVIPESKFLEMEIFVREVVHEPIFKLQADMLMTVDGLKALLAENLSIQLQADWLPITVIPDQKALSDKFHDIVCDEIQIENTVRGKPSLAFGGEFRVFDYGKRMARLPSYPYLFLSRISYLDAKYCGMKVGSRIRSEWDVPQKHPLIISGIPFCVLLEALLQPCGWLGSYIGCPVSSSKEIFFRNLEGDLLLKKLSIQTYKKLTCDVEVTSLVKLSDTIIIEFKVLAYADGVPYVDLKTQFGYFTQESLHNQVEKISPENFEIDWNKINSLYLDSYNVFGSTCFGEKSISPKDWYFKSHFFQDPVMPGSLGLEAMLESGKLLSNSVGDPSEIKWKYRGQLLPHNKKMTVKTERKDEVFTSFLYVDGRKIYDSSFKF